MNSYDIAILGCGWAGIVTGYFVLNNYPYIDVICIDRDNELGGLLKTVIVNGFQFDVGGSHVIFSRNQEILNEMISFLSTNIIEHHRKAYVYLNGIFVPYPFENGIWLLPSEIRAKISISFVEALIERFKNKNWRPNNLYEWIYGFFGKEIAKLYLEPYNEKIWKRSLDYIDVDWIYTPGRVPTPDWKDILRSCAGIPTEGYKEQSRFYYPLKGGIQSLYEAVIERALAKGLKIVRGEIIRNIKRIGDEWIINNRIRAKRVISTIPLNELIEALDPTSHIAKLARELDYNSVAVVGLALKKRAPNMHWIYVPNKDIVFHRYAWISNYSPYATPDNNSYSAIIAEITAPPNHRIDVTKLVEQTMEGLKNLGIISESEKEILFTKVWTHKYGYPVHTISSNRVREELLGYAKELGIEVAGRWGSWRYLNMDQIYMQAYNLVHKLLLH